MREIPNNKTKGNTMNILDKTDKSIAPTFGERGGGVTKQSKYGWAGASDRGSFCMVDKHELNIDGEYQREVVSDQKVFAIARQWDWRIFGTISVVKREDDSLWVYDGGHRTRAAFLRSDITELPCMVFNCGSAKEEARAFLGANTMKNAVSAYHKHKAAIVACDEDAMRVESIVTKHGCHTTYHNKSRYGFCAVGALNKMAKDDACLADAVFEFCADVADNGEAFSGSLMQGLFVCARKLGIGVGLFSGKHREKLASYGIKGIELAMRRESHIAGRGGSSVFAKAVLDILNKGKQKRLRFE